MEKRGVIGIKNFVLFLFGIIFLFTFFVSAESGMVVFQNATTGYTATPQYKTWNESTFNTTLNATPVTGTLYWNVLKNNPIRNEIILGTLDSNSDIKVQFYNSTFSWGSTYDMTLVSGVSTLRAFDTSIEQVSGDVVVAYNNGTAGIIGYRIWNGSSWYKSGNLTTNLTGQVNWIKLASDRNSNKIMMIASDANARLVGLVWNGSNWTTSYLLETVLYTAAKENFDVAFENSGDALVIWAETVTAYPKYITYSNNSWGVEGSGPASSAQAAGFQWFRLANYPNTDRIMSCYVDIAADFNCAEWTGSGWGSVYEITAGGEYANGVSFRNFDVVPDISSQSFFLMWASSNEDYYRTIRCFGQANCQAGVWESAQTFLSAVDIGTDTAWAYLTYDPENAGKIIALMADQSSFTKYLARISCSNSANSCVADQTSTLITTSTSSTYESEMFSYFGKKPIIQNISTITSIPASTLISISANNVNDTNFNLLNFYCSASNLPTASNTLCTGGNTSVSYPYTGTSCSYNSQSTDGTYTIYCRVYDGDLYSSAVNVSYTVSSTAPTTSVVSVAGDTIASYYDSVNDGRTLINISGESGMTCKWAISDLAYSGMSNTCDTSGIYAACNITGISVEGFYTRYISCANTLGVGQTASQNLDINFYLDYTASTTADNSDEDVQAPNYIVTITEGDAVDSDPISYYCTSSIVGCNPTSSIDNGGTITYTSSNRGVNYLRYYSLDDAGNTQVVVNKTINMNRLPVFLSAVDDSGTIKGGSIVNVSVNFTEYDSGQEIKLYVCSSSGATASGCTGNTYCNSNSTQNHSCSFASEIDSAVHVWYAYIFDELNESATSNPLIGSYTSDSTSPVITLANPINVSTLTQSSVTITISVNEGLSGAWYSLDGGSNNVTIANSSLYAYSHSNTSIADGTYNLSIWANDSVGNIGSLSGNYFVINIVVPDTTPPTITIHSPTNNSYNNNSEILINISSDEVLKWAGYKLNDGSLTSLDNYTALNWNITLTLTEGQQNLTIYVNDTSNNQANKSSVFYVDLANPQVLGFSCTDKNDSENVICSFNLSDSIGIDYAIVGDNSTGVWQNSSQISLGRSLSFNSTYTIGAGNTTPPMFSTMLFVYDLSGRINDSSSDLVLVSDDTFPEIYNISYYPNTTDLLDPESRVYVNATIVEDYRISSVVLMYKNSTATIWSSVVMENNSAIANGSSATVIYNASFLPNTDTWYFKINATDIAGNQNISSVYILVVANDSSFWNYTSIGSTESFTYAQRTGNNSLGVIQLNNTGDMGIGLNITISADSSILNRFSINYTQNQGANYTLEKGVNLSISFEVNTSDLSTALYPYNITLISEAGTIVYQNNLYVQTAEGAYLQILIDTYSSSVTTSQTGVIYGVSVTNLGTQDATNVVLNWTLPGIFTLTSGNLSRSFSSIPIGGSGTNTISVNVGSSTSDLIYYINASASASNAESVSTFKSISVSNPVTITQVVTTPSGGGSGGGGAGGGSFGGGLKPVVYSKEIEVVRSESNIFEIEVKNKFSDKLENLILQIEGFPLNYISISPSKLSLNPGETGKFIVKLTAPSYKDYEELDLKAIIEGTMVGKDSSSSYKEIQNVKLVIQEISKSKSSETLSEAEKAIALMKKNGFNTQKAEELFNQGNLKLNENRNKEAYDFANEVIKLKDASFRADNLIKIVQQAMNDPRKMSLLAGDVVREVKNENGQIISVQDILTGKAIFESKSAEEVLGLAVAAFERGDFATAEERAKSAQILLILERKGNIFLFLYLYWPFVLFAIVFIFTGGIVSYRIYKKNTISGRIVDINEEESNIKKLMAETQKSYFSGKVSAHEYHRILAQHNKRISEIRKDRLNLRNKRVKVLSSQEEIQDLEKEGKQAEEEIKKIQEDFYKDKKISETEYKGEFQSLNERIAEIEDEKTTIHVLKKQDEKKGWRVFNKLIDFKNKKKKNEEEKWKERIGELLKKEFKQ